MVTARSSNLLGKITVVVVICCLVMGIFVVNTVLALDGSGTEQDPWRIRSLDDFNDFAADANYWDGWTRLETDVNLAGMVYESAVIAWDANDDKKYFQGTTFTGVFDGNDHIVAQLAIDSNYGDYIGLFGYVDGPNAEIKNLGLFDPDVQAGTGDCIGSLVGSIWYGTVTNCSANGGSVSGNVYVGGLMGVNCGSVSNCFATGVVGGNGAVGGLTGAGDGSFLYCYSTGSVSGEYRVGGLVGYKGPLGIVSNCYSTCDVNGVLNAGGLVGFNDMFCSVSNCYATGDVNGERIVGGLVGRHHGSVSNCYSTGSVSSEDWIVGGLVGLNYDGSASNCYATGSVNGVLDVGGLVGDNFGSVSNCYSTCDVNGVDDVGGLIGYNGVEISFSFWDTDTQTHGVTDSIGRHYGTETNIEGLPTAQLHQQSTFTNWDFINVWDIGENQTYPYLRVYLSSDINKDGIVNFLDVAITANQWMEGVE